MSTKESKESMPGLSNAEWEVMKILWEEGPMAARDVYAALPKDNEWAYNTLKALISRLVQKEAVEYDQIGNSYLYRAAVSREKVTRKEIRTFIDRVLDGAWVSMVAHFVDEGDASAEDIENLRQMLDEMDKKKKGGKSR